MKGLFCSWGLGQYYCIYPVQEEFINRGYETDAICMEFCAMFKPFSDINVEDYDFVLATDVIYPRSFQELNKHPKKLMMSMVHTIAMKSETWVSDMLSYGIDGLFEAGSYAWDTLKQEKPEYVSEENRVIVGGFPKSDYTIKNKKDTKLYRQMLVNRFGFNPIFPIVLYAPTWGYVKVFSSVSSEMRWASSTLNQLQDIVKYLGNVEINVIVAPHPGSLKVLNEFPIKLPKNIRIVLDHNKNDLILGSDLVISEVSSMVMESCLVNKPILHLCNDEDEEALNLWNKKNRPLCKIGREIRIPSQFNILEIAIRDQLKKDTYLKEKNFWLSKLADGVTGNDAKKYADEIEKRLK